MNDYFGIRMSIDGINFSPWPALAGGLVIGLASAKVAGMLLNDQWLAWPAEATCALSPNPAPPA